MAVIKERIYEVQLYAMRRYGRKLHYAEADRIYFTYGPSLTDCFMAIDIDSTATGYTLTYRPNPSVLTELEPVRDERDAAGVPVAGRRVA